MVGGTSAALAAKAVTTKVPIVFTVAGDPVGVGLVASLARLGGNATGLSNLVADLSEKQLELLKAAVPQLSRVTVLYNPGNSAARSALNGARNAARALAMELRVLEVRQPKDLASALSAPTAQSAGALLAIGDPVFGNILVQLAELSVKNRLPAMYINREFAEAGGLMTYGSSFSENYRRAATYVDKILRSSSSESGRLP